MRAKVVLVVLAFVFGTVPALGFQAATSSASANECSGSPWVYKIRVVKRNKKDLSSIYSKHNSNKYESAPLSVNVWSSSSDSSAVTLGTSYKLSTVVDEVEAKYDISITKSVSSGVSVTNTMEVMPLYYGRTKWQTIRTVYEKYRTRRYGADCHLERETIWRARLITSRVHFAECQDKTNDCKPT